MTNAIALTTGSPLALLLDPAKFDHLQRVGKMLALSPLFPEHLRKGGNEAAIANGALVLNMAFRLNEDPLTVAQNIYFVGGKPGWNTTYMIGKANQNGVFSDPIDWDVNGEGQSLSVTAFGILARTGKRVQVTLDMETAKKEGWTKNPKYQSIPEQMLRYRTAAFLIRLYCPEVMIGLPAQIEQELEMKDITPPSEAAAPVSANGEPPIDVQPERVQPDPAQEEARRPTRAELQKQYQQKQAETARKPAQEPRKAEVYNPPKEDVKAQPEPDYSAPQDDTADLVEEAAEATGAETVDPYSTPFGKTFLKDVTDMGWDAAWDFHGDQIQTLKANDPAFHAALMAEARQIDPNAPEV